MNPDYLLPAFLVIAVAVILLAGALIVAYSMARVMRRDRERFHGAGERAVDPMSASVTRRAVHKS